MTLDPHAWRQGFESGQRDEPVCPYAASTREGWSWSSGYIEGKAASATSHETNSGNSTLKFSRASVKRRWALLESNPPSNNRGVRLQTAAEGGGANASSPRHSLPVVRTLWLENSRSRAPRGEDSWCLRRRDSERLPLQAGLIA